jgi:hypothetical protein
MANFWNLITLSYTTSSGAVVEIPNQTAVIRTPRPQPICTVAAAPAPSPAVGRPLVGQIWPRGATVVESEA